MLNKRKRHNALYHHLSFIISQSEGISAQLCSERMDSILIDTDSAYDGDTSSSCVESENKVLKPKPVNTSKSDEIE